MNSLWWAVASSRFSPDAAAQAARSDNLSKWPWTRSPTNRFSDGLDDVQSRRQIGQRALARCQTQIGAEMGDYCERHPGVVRW